MAPPFLWIPVALFLLLLTIIHLGSFHGSKQPEDLEPKTGVVSTSGLFFSLLSLVLAFTLYDANSRLAERRQLIAREAAGLRILDLRLERLPGSDQAVVRSVLRRYADSRANYALTGVDIRALRDAYRETREIQSELWRSIEASRRASPSDPTVDQALLAMQDLLRLAAERHAAAFSHVPMLIYLFIGVLACGSAYIAGRSLRGRFREQIGTRLAFCAVISLTVYAICDLDHPREGLIRLDRIDQAFDEIAPSELGFQKTDSP